MSDMSEITDRLSDLKLLAPAGFAMAFHIRFTTPTFLLQSYPQDWITHYSQNGLVMHDPTVRWGFENTGAIKWSELKDEDPAGVIEQAAEYGMKFGLTYSLNLSDSLTVTTFSRTDSDFDQASIERIQRNVEFIHENTLDNKGLPVLVMDALKKMSITATMS